MALERSTLTLIVNIITTISPWNSECNRFQNIITSPFSLISGLILLILTWMQQIMMVGQKIMIVGQMETKIIFLSWKNLEFSGRTALHLAACEGHLACVRFSRNQNLLYVLIGTPGLCQVVLPTSNFYVLHSIGPPDLVSGISCHLSPIWKNYLQGFCLKFVKLKLNHAIVGVTHLFGMRRCSQGEQTSF